MDIGACGRHRPQCRHRSSRCQASIGVCRRSSMQHLFNRSRSRPSWVMQGNAPRARKGARGFQRHRRESRHRDFRCQTSIGHFHFAVAVDIGDASGIGGDAGIGFPDVQLPSGFAVPVAAVDLGVASGIGGNASIAFPDVPLPSDLATRPSPWTSGLAGGIGRNAAIAVPDVKRLSELAVAAQCNTSLIEAEVDPAESS